MRKPLVYPLILASLVAPCVTVLSADGPGNTTRAVRPATGTVVREVDHQIETPEAQMAAADPQDPLAGFQLDWHSINGGGATNATGGTYGLGVSLGQSVAGFASGGTYTLGLGFWYGTGVGGVCPIVQTGDVNLSGTLTAGDIIHLVNFVFKSGPDPLPCEAAGDVNCSFSVTSGDIIYMVNHVFKSGALPCNVCTLIPGSWTCP